VSEHGSESENPVIPSPAPTPHRPRTNQDWWPNQPNLQVLHHHLPDPRAAIILPDSSGFTDPGSGDRPAQAETAAVRLVTSPFGPMVYASAGDGAVAAPLSLKHREGG
jgi:hypothetical protein